MGIFDLFKRKKNTTTKTLSHTRYWLDDIATIELPDDWNVSTIDRFVATAPNGKSNLAVVVYQSAENTPINDVFFENFTTNLNQEFQAEGYNPLEEFYTFDGFIGQTFSGKGEVQYHLATAKNIDNQVFIIEFLLKSEEPFSQDKKDFLYKVGKSLSYVSDFVQLFVKKIENSDTIDIISVHGMEIKYIQKATNSIQTKYLGNAYSEYLYKNDALEEILEKYTSRLYNKQELSISKENIYPLVRNVTFIKNNPSSDTIFYEDINEELIVIYAIIDHNQNLKYVTNEQVTQLNENIRAIAIDNLTHKIEVSLEENNGMYQLIANGNLEPSYLLIPEVWTKQNFPVEGDIIVAIPNENTILATDSLHKANMEIIKQKIQDNFQNKEQVISDKLFSLDNEKWIIIS